ncbi:MAG: dephospho-CoA kinase [Clostridiales bacterium]|nr:dephospho-CoA kinase [Clostridiales bacterium]
MNKPFFIGLTGPTGAGKGFVSEYLKSSGFNVIDSDKIVKDIYESNLSLIKTLADEFGCEILENEKINRKALAKLVFSSDENKNKLNSIVHPFVIEECEKRTSILSVLDAPQLFEARAQSKCYKIISVIADKETRIKRIISRDNITKEQALERINAQYDDDFYISHSDFVIYNNGEDVESQINNILEEIL